MAAFARESGLDVEVARFEDWDPAGRTFDAVIAGQTWHWIDPIAGAAKAATVLRPGGRLAVFWNVFQPPPEVADAFSEVYRQVLPTYNLWARPALDLYAAIFAKTADGIHAAGGFGSTEQWRFDWARAYTRDEWLEAALTGGDSSQIPQATREELLAGIGAAIDVLAGRITMGYATVVVTATRPDASGLS